MTTCPLPTSTAGHSSHCHCPGLSPCQDSLQNPDFASTLRTHRSVPQDGLMLTEPLRLMHKGKDGENQHCCSGRMSRVA